jgi:hypothetical protein
VHDAPVVQRLAVAERAHTMKGCKTQCFSSRKSAVAPEYHNSGFPRLGVGTMGSKLISGLCEAAGNLNTVNQLIIVRNNDLRCQGIKLLGLDRPKYLVLRELRP